MLRIGQVEPSATADGKYTDGSVAGGIAATRLRAAAFNAMQEELANIVESAGMNLNPNDMTQVLSALKKQFLSRKNPFADIKADGEAAVTTALSNLHLVGGVAGDAVGRLVGIQKITSSKTYTPTPGTKFAVVEMVGGGGAGGSPAQNGAGFTSGSGGGSSGCYVRFLVDLSAISSVNCTIGASGITAAQSPGGMGGDTSFGGFATALGGYGGLLLSSSNSANRIFGMSPLRTNFGSISNASLLDFDNGSTGGDAIILSSGARAGVGGKSRLSGNTFGPGNDTAGIDATTYGGGGSGVVATNSSIGTNLLGGKGAGGVIIIWEYA